MIPWIIFNDDRIHNSSENILDENVIVRQLVVTMVRNVHFAAGNEFANSLKSLAHPTSQSRGNSPLSGEYYVFYRRHPTLSLCGEWVITILLSGLLQVIKTLPSAVQTLVIVMMFVFTMGMMSFGFTPNDAIVRSLAVRHASKDIGTDCESALSAISFAKTISEKTSIDKVTCLVLLMDHSPVAR